MLDNYSRLRYGSNMVFMMKGVNAMATITLKNIPEQLYKKLKQRAKQHYRSLNSEVIVCLQNALESKKVDPNLLLKRAHVLRSTMSGHLTDKDLSLMKNQDRP